MRLFLLPLILLTSCVKSGARIEEEKVKSRGLGIELNKISWADKTTCDVVVSSFGGNNQVFVVEVGKLISFGNTYSSTVTVKEKYFYFSPVTEKECAEVKVTWFDEWKGKHNDRR